MLLSPEPSASRRLKVVRVSFECLTWLLQLDGKSLRRIEGLPADAKLVWANQRPDSCILELVFESASFEDVPEGYGIPELQLSASCTYPQPGLFFPAA